MSGNAMEGRRWVENEFTDVEDNEEHFSYHSPSSMCGLSFSWFFSRLLIKALPTLLEQWNLHKNPESYSFLGGVCFHSWNHTSAEDPPFQRRFATLSMQSTISKYCRSKNLGWAICWKGETRIILRSFCLVFDKTRFLDIKCCKCMQLPHFVRIFFEHNLHPRDIWFPDQVKWHSQSFSPKEFAKRLYHRED